jgi:MerR family transcriptional regulator/heat shock protein HspR
MQETTELFFISMVARELDLHPQTLRKYERLGLVRPTRTVGSMRVYSREEIERIRVIKHLVDEAGINLAGVHRLLSVAECLARIRPLVDDAALSRQEGRRRLSKEIDRLAALLGL